MDSQDKRRYILRNNENEELIRLGFQHQVWLEETANLWKRAGFGIRQTLLDLGCGPGYLSFDLSKLVGPEGHVIALDNSDRFIDHIRTKITQREYHNITAEVADIQKLKLEKESVDGAIARWVLMFVEDPETVVEQVARVLKPNGVFAVMDYFQFRSMSLWPKSGAFEKVYHAVYELIKSHGGDADVGGDIPEILTRHGFKKLDIYPIYRIGRPDTLLWDWLEATNKNHSNLIEAGLITQEDLQQYYQDWSAHSKNPNAFFTTPPILVTIGVKMP